MPMSSERKQVFFVDDEPEIVKLIEIFMKKAPEVECHYFTKAMDAIIAINSGKLPDLVVTDINMPELDGFMFVKKITEVNKDIPFVYCSAFSNLKLAFDAIECSYDDQLVRDFYVKPIKRDIIEFITKNLE